MRKLVWLLLPVVVGSCGEAKVGFDAVSLRPIYGWEDGCNTVKISGHGFTDDVTANIGGAPVTNITLPDPETNPLDVGFLFYATVPAGTVGFADVTVINGDGEESTIPRAYYYVACPLGEGVPYAEAVSQTEGVTAGTEIVLTGCNLQADAMQVQVGDADPVPLTSVCGEGIASFTAPDLPDSPEGGYLVSFLDTSGNLIYPTNPCPPETTGGGDTGTDTDVPTDTDTDVPTDTDTDVPTDTSPDTAVPACDEALYLVYGGAQ